MRLLISLSLCAVCLGGCMQRTLTITSEPEGALVWVNDVEVGRTPVETSFTFYGTYDVRLRKEGYEPLSTCRVARTPVYEYPPIDFVTMALPWRTNTKIAWHFDLEPEAEVVDPVLAETELLERAGDLRAATTAGRPLESP